MDYPKISVVTTSYNQGEYLERTIQSVLNQKYPNLEYIIIDGGSTDESLEIIKRYEGKLAYWESASDNGMYDALNKGFTKSTGVYLAWINSDDMYHQGAFSIVHEVFSKFQEVEWLTGVPSCIDNKDRTIWLGKYRKWSVYNILNGDFRWIQQESTFWKRSLWERAGGRLSLDYKYAGDFELWCRFFRHAKLYNVNALIGGYRKRGKNQAALDNQEQYINEMHDIVNKLANEYNGNEIVQNINQIDKQLRLLQKSRVFNVKAITSRLEKKKISLFEYPPTITFDAKSQEYIKE